MNGSHNVGSENVFGVGIENSKNLYDCVDADNSENCRYADGAMSHKDSMDILFSGGHSHNLYGTINVGSHASGVRFSVSSKFSRDSEFIFNCKNVSNCFMCFGLQNKSYCILNKQYEKEEYFKIVDELKTKMLERGEYANGLGLEFSAQPYNFSSGYSTYPMTEEEISKIGSYVGTESDSNAGDIVKIKPEDVPETIIEVSDDILSKAIICEKTGRPFRITPSELEFYRQMKLPLPTLHPTPRMRIFADFKPTSKKYEAFCGKCGKQTSVMFNPDYGFNLYCEKCYQAEVV
jgi:CxxC-x17-CxxC domain-containing protein